MSMFIIIIMMIIIIIIMIIIMIMIIIIILVLKELLRAHRHMRRTGVVTMAGAGGSVAGEIIQRLNLRHLRGAMANVP
jgi:hypothetical protein